MTDTALVLTYHAIESGPPPLCLGPEPFASHLDRLVGEGASTLTVSQLAAALRRGELPPRAVAITFDDGAASVARVAAPLLAERGLTATLFCVAGHLGGSSDWPTQPARAPTYSLAAVEDLRDLAAAGFEIGSHGLAHAPLDTAGEDVLRRELVASRQALEDAVGVEVTSFAYPYGVRSRAARDLARTVYRAAVGTELALVRRGADPLDLPRVDAYYVRTTDLLGDALAGTLGLELRARRLARRARRLVRKDYEAAR